MLWTQNNYVEFKMVATNTPLRFGRDQELVIEKFERFPKNFLSVNCFCICIVVFENFDYFWIFNEFKIFWTDCTYIKFYGIFFGKNLSRRFYIESAMWNHFCQKTDRLWGEVWSPPSIAINWTGVWSAKCLLIHSNNSL